jgi:hypothetical protein
MNTVTKLAKATCFFLLASHTVYSQRPSAAKNFISFFSGRDWSSRSHFEGVSYERLVYQKAVTEIGVRGSYTFPYRQNDASWLYSQYGPSFTEVKLSGHAYSFPGKSKTNNGLFITAGAGIESLFWKEAKVNYRHLSPTGELGFGWKWPIGKKRLVLCWVNTLNFSINRAYANGDFMSTTKLSLGF